MSQPSLVVSAGEHDREHCPVWAEIDPSLVGDGDVVLKDEAGNAIPCQVLKGETTAVCCVLDKLAKGQTRTLSLACEAADVSGVTLTDVPGEKVDVDIAGKRFTSYHYADKWVRPFLLPIAGPFGDTITRHFPVEEMPGEKEDHPHHKSCWVAWGEVNGEDHWSEVGDRYARQVHQALAAVESGPVFGRIVAQNHWMNQAGDAKVLEEERSYTFYNTPQMGRLMDVTVTLSATEGPVEFGDTKEGGIISIRVATSMDAAVDGTIVNAYGGTNEAETWGKRSPWCDYYGPVNGNTVGITIFDSPLNFRYPTYWHVRNYGLMTANPFGLSYFYNDKSRDGSHTLEAGGKLSFKYRLYFHAGDTCAANVSGKFLDHVAPPAVEVK